MIAFRKLFPVAFALAAAVGSTSGKAADAIGCRDVDGVGRFLGSSLVMCVNKDFAEYVLPTGKMRKFNLDTNKPTFQQQLSLEGRLTQNVYAVPAGASSAEVFRNFRQLLQSRNYSVLYDGKQAELGDSFGKYFETVGPGTQIFGYSADEARYLAASKEENGVKSYLALYVVEYEDGYDPKFEPAKGQVMVRLDAVQVGGLENRMVVVSADEIDRKLRTDGRIALYGIHFDFNSATIKPESRQAIDQIAAYLTSNAARKLSIFGHTDNVGGPDFNLKLSRARADAVVFDLINRYGIDADRIAAAGIGMQQPIAPNDSEEGRAANRRVELVSR